MTITYLDAGVLIAAVRQDRRIAERAVVLLNDAERTFVSSVFLRLEVFPKAVYHRNRFEVALYEAFFARVSHWAEPIERIVELAEPLATQHGLNALDALHVAAAITLGADELVTTEKPGKPIYRIGSVRVVLR